MMRRTFIMANEPNRSFYSNAIEINNGMFTFGYLFYTIENNGRPNMEEDELDLICPY